MRAPTCGRLAPRISAAEELIMAIGDYIDKYNDNPKPLLWAAKACDILKKGQARSQGTE